MEHSCRLKWRTLHAGDVRGKRRDPPVPQEHEKGFHEEGDALDLASTLFEHEDARQRKNPRQLPATEHIRLEFGDGRIVEGDELRRRAFALRD